MDENKGNEIYVSLFDDEGNAYTYQLETMFSVGGIEQQYCSAVSVDGDDIRFLRCFLEENEEESELSIAAIENEDEYTRVKEEYEDLVLKAALSEAQGKLSERGDLITLIDTEGRKVNYILHLWFADEATNRSYVAVQVVDEAGDIAKEISLLRVFKEGNEHYIDRIPSTSEFQRARDLFKNLLEEK